jgi:hypothetical protein
MTTVHDFKQKLAESQAASLEPFWNAVYQRAFPGLVNHMPCPGDVLSQRMGIDRLIMLETGRIIRIDEKKRDRVYPDILLEYLSNDRTGAPGWIEKPLLIDYLAYAFMPSHTVYLFDWLMLRRAWIHYRTEWKAKYYKVRAQNVGYVTESVAVPIKVVRDAVQAATIIKLDMAIIKVAA